MDLVGGPSLPRRGRAVLLSLLLVALLLASLGATPALSAHPSAIAPAAFSPSAARVSPAVAPPAAVTPGLSPLSAGDVARSVLVNYNATWTGNFASSVDDFEVGPGAFVPATGYLWLSDLRASAVGGPLPKYAPAILFDPATNSYAGIVPQLTNTSDLVYDPSNGFLYSADTANNTVGVFNPATDKWAAPAIPVGSEPVSLALDSQTGSLFVANYGSSNLTVIATSTNTVSQASIATGSEPFELAIDPTNQTLYVACAESLFLTLVNASTFATPVLPVFSLGGDPAGVAYSPETGSVAASVPSRSLVTIYNVTNGAPTTIPVGPGVGAVAALPTNSDFIVANTEGANLVTLNPITGKEVNSTILVGESPKFFDINPSNGNLYVWSSISRNLSLVWSGGALTTVNSPSLGPAPAALAYDVASDRVLVANSNDSTISFLSPLTLRTVAPPLQLGSVPLSLAADPATGMVYAGLENGLVMIDPSTASVVATSTAFTGATEALLVDSPVGILWALNSVHGLVGYEIQDLTSTLTSGIGAGQTGIHTLALDPTTDELFLPVNTSGTSGIGVVNATTGVVVNADAVSAADLVSLAYDPADGDVYGLGTNLSITNASTLTPAGPPLDVAPHTVAGVVTYDPSREYIYAATQNGRNASGTLSVIDGSSAAAAYLSEVNLGVGEGPVAAVPVQLPDSSAPGTGEVWIADSVGGTVDVVASSPPQVTSFEAVPDEFDLGATTQLTLTYSGGAGVSTISYTHLPTGCASNDTTDLNCTPSEIGTYTVTVHVTDELGDKTTATTNITIIAGLVVSATFLPVTFPQTDAGWAFEMTASVEGGGGSYTYFWSFGDGTNASGQVVYHPYAKAGIYVLSLTVNDTLGATGSASWAVQVNPDIAETLYAPSLTTDVGRPLSFFANITGGTDTNGSAIWSFGDTSTQISPSATHIWTQAGLYNVTATAVDEVNDRANETVQVRVNPAPAAQFSVSGGSVAVPPQPGTLFYYNATVFGGTAPFTVLWKFGDGSQAYGTKVTHSYSEAGNYTVTAQVTDQAGAVVNGTLMASVGPAPSTAPSSSSLTFPVGVFLGVVLGAAVAAVLVFAATRKRRKARPPPPPSPYVAPTHAAWKED